MYLTMGSTSQTPDGGGEAWRQGGKGVLYSPTMSARQSARKPLLHRRLPWIGALVAGAVVPLSPPFGPASATEPEPPSGQSAAAPARTYRDALFVEALVGFSPIFNDVPLMVGLGVRVADVHELWARAGVFVNGWDIGYGIGAIGYRAALRPRRRVRPLVGAFIAGEPATCTGLTSAGHPMCHPDPLFYFAANGGLRLEPRPWLGVLSTLSIGVDSIGFPFGMIEVGMSLALPQTEPRAKGR